MLNKAWQTGKDAFNKQLQLNLKELSSKNHYPLHWLDIVDLIEYVKPKSILDIGCGAGSLYKLCLQEGFNIKYSGIDYAESAILLAKAIGKIIVLV